MKSKRIAIAGHQHETNWFNPRATKFAHFEMAASWPKLLEVDEVVMQTRDMNLFLLLDLSMRRMRRILNCARSYCVLWNIPGWSVQRHFTRLVKKF